MSKAKGIALNKGNRHAFTLIELLIVIAIIAILALIAIPNFLESQMRAKVSRAYADTRSLATALQAYQVDYNCPAPGFWSTWSIYNFSSTSEVTAARPYDGLEVLTTPIAYATAIPPDPFKEKGYRNSETPNPDDMNKERNRTYNYESCRPIPNPLIFTNSKNRRGLFWMRTNGYEWCLASPGPSRDAAASVVQLVSGQVSGGTNNNIYDPSNGTTSKGWIIRTNQGQLTAIPTTSNLPDNTNPWY